MITTAPIAFALFSLGAILGSFLNVVALRLPRRQSFTGDTRSVCPRCGHQLAWRELIPLVSFIAQRGRCHACRRPISARYPLVELATGLLTVLLLWPALVGSALTGAALAVTLLHLLIVNLLILLFLIDADTFLLPNRIILLLALAAVLRQFILGQLTTPSPYLGAAVGGGFLALLWLLTRGRGIGLGDVKLMVPLGLLFGPLATTVLLFLAFGTGAAGALYLLATGQATPKTAIPFGPYLCAAAILLLVFPHLPATITTFLGY